MLTAALAAAEQVPIFPVWWTVNGVCACSAGEHCDRPGKHPLITNWGKRATQNPAQIKRWLRRWPRANWAMPTGERSGYVIVDTLPGSRPRLQPTFTVRTGNAEHWYYRWPGHEVRNREIKAHGVDVIRGDGGYVLIPPCVHANGTVYEVIRRGGVRAFPAALLPHSPPAPRKTGVDREGYVSKGERHPWLFTVGCSMRHFGVREPGIRAALLAMNEHQCVPPKSEADIKRLAHDIAKRYSASASGPRWPRLDFPCPLCGGVAAATFKTDRYGELGWLISCWGECSENGSRAEYLPKLATELGLEKSALKEAIVARIATGTSRPARLPLAVPDPNPRPIPPHTGDSRKPHSKHP